MEPPKGLRNHTSKKILQALKLKGVTAIAPGDTAESNLLRRDEKYIYECDLAAFRAQNADKPSNGKSGRRNFCGAPNPSVNASAAR